MKKIEKKRKPIPRDQINFSLSPEESRALNDACAALNEPYRGRIARRIVVHCLDAWVAAEQARRQQLKQSLTA